MIFDIPETSLLLQGEHSIFMVTLSVGIAIFASIMAFNVSTLASASVSNSRKQLSIFSGSIALGGGIWSMHFIGMLAFELCTSVTFSWQYTFVSLVPAIGASWIALQFLIRQRFTIKQLLISGVSVGSGIGAMHYIGMAGMEMAPLLRYDLNIFLLSIVVAVFFSCVSLWFKFGLQKSQLLKGLGRKINLIAGTVMGIAISSMHYTGMAAARFVLPPGFEKSAQPDEMSTYLALAITGITLITSLVVLTTTLIFKYKDISAIALKNEKRLSATINTAIDGIITIDANGIIISANNALESMLGWTESDLLNKNVKIIIPAEIHSHHDDYLKKYFIRDNKNKFSIGRKLELVAKSGEKIPVSLTIGHVELENEELVVGYLTDLREQLKMQEAIKESELKFRSLASNIPGITYRCENRDNHPMLFVSEEIERVTGYPAADFLAPRFEQNFSNFILEEDLAHILPIVNSSKDAFVIEYRLRDRYGAIKWMLGYGRKVNSDNKKDSYIDGIIMDITPRKKMEEALIIEKNKAQQAAEARAAFMANMSHEIRTPMNAIIGFSDILLVEDLPSEQQKYVTTIHDSAKSLLYILNDILDSAKMDKGELAIELRDFSVIEIVDSVISTLGLQAHKKGINLVLNVDPNIPVWVEGAPERLRQILMNIIGNAVKFTHQGNVRINVAPATPDSIKFEIEDDGIGMSEEQLNKVFQPFVQADASMSRKYGGTGLGTTIAKQLIELMNGEISVTSELNKGTCFTIVLPLPETELDKNTNAQKANEKLTRNLSILVADDVKQNLDLLTLILQRASHQVTCVNNGEEAFNEVFEHDYDIVLMDVQMPVLDGLSASRKIRDTERQQELQRTPIIALTASVLENDKLAARQSGMDGFTHKPIIPDKLFAEIERVLVKGKAIEEQSTTSTNDVNPSTPANSSSINYQRGMSLWGDKDTLVSEIKRFLETMNLDSIIEAMHANEAPSQKMKDELHRLKGVAGNLGLDTLFEQINDLESSIAKNSVLDTSYEKALTQSVADIQAELVVSVKQRSQELQKDKVKVEINEFVKHLNLLLNDINHNALEDDVVDKVVEITPEQFSFETQAIIDLCNDFEFAQASKAITELLKKIEKL